MRSTRFLPVIVTSVAALTMLFGCSKSSSSADKATFCNDNAVIDKAGAALGANATPDQVVAVIKSHQSTVDEFLKTAPSDIKADAQILVDAANAAVTTNKPDALGSANVQAAGKRVDTYCGQNADGSPAGTATTASGG